MIETKTKEINGREWSCTQWAGSKNLRMFHRLTTILMPALSSGAPIPKISAAVNIPAAVDALVRGLGSSKEFEALILELLDGVHIDRRHVTRDLFDEAFVGPRLFDLAPGLRFVIETNFGDFSQLVASIMSRFGDQQPGEILEPNGSTND